MATVDWSNQKLQRESPLPSEEYVVKAMPAILNTFDMTALYLVSIFFIVNSVSAATVNTCRLHLLAALWHHLLCTMRHCDGPVGSDVPT